MSVSDNTGSYRSSNSLFRPDMSLGVYKHELVTLLIPLLLPAPPRAAAPSSSLLRLRSSSREERRSSFPASPPGGAGSSSGFGGRRRTQRTRPRSLDLAGASTAAGPAGGAKSGVDVPGSGMDEVRLTASILTPTAGRCRWHASAVPSSLLLLLILAPAPSGGGGSGG